MDEDEIRKLKIAALELNTDLCILKNAVTNNTDNDLQLSDLIDFVEKIYKMSDEIRRIAAEL